MRYTSFSKHIYPSENVSLFSEVSNAIANQLSVHLASFQSLQCSYSNSDTCSLHAAEVATPGCVSMEPLRPEVTRVRCILAQWSFIYRFYSENTYCVLSRSQRGPVPEAGDPEVN